MRPIWPSERVRVGVVMRKMNSSEPIIELQQINPWETDLLPFGVEMVPAELSRIDFKSLLLVIDKHKLPEEQIRPLLSCKRILVKEGVEIPGNILKELGFSQAIRLTPKAFLLCRDRHLFHHFLECQPLNNFRGKTAKRM